MKYHGGNKEFETKLQSLLDKNFRDNEKIDAILCRVFNDVILRTSFCIKFQRMNKGASLVYFLGLESFHSITAHEIFKNHLCKEKALFVIVQRKGQEFYDFFTKVTLKHYGYLIEEIILDISPFPQTISKEKQLLKILNEIFLCNLYRDFLNKLSSNNDALSCLSNRKMKKKLIGLFKTHENKKKLEAILFFLVKHGNQEYWENKTINDLFL